MPPQETVIVIGIGHGGGEFPHDPFEDGQGKRLDDVGEGPESHGLVDILRLRRRRVDDDFWLCHS